MYLRLLLTSSMCPACLSVSWCHHDQGEAEAIVQHVLKVMDLACQDTQLTFK